jgi:hypothetical protein
MSTAEEPWHYEHAKRAVRFVVVHSKNDRRPNSAQLDYTVPRGVLSKLLLAHCVEGHGILTLVTENMARLFVTRQVGLDSVAPSLRRSVAPSPCREPYYVPRSS